jgi:YD repeat-containing protein
LTYTYDVFGRLSTARDNTSMFMGYAYDGLGHLIGESDSTGGYSQETVWFDGQPVATVQNGVVCSIRAAKQGAPRSRMRRWKYHFE